MWYFWFVCCLGSHISKSKSKQKIAVGCVGLNYSDNIYMHCSEIWKLGRKNAWRTQNKWLQNDTNLVWNILSFRLLDIWHQTFMQLYSSVLWLSSHSVGQFIDSHLQKLHDTPAVMHNISVSLPTVGLIQGQISFSLQTNHARCAKQTTSRGKTR